MSLVTLLIMIVLWGVIFYILFWGLGTIALPEPFAKIGKVILVLAAVLVAIGLLTGSIHTFPFLTHLL